MLCHEGMRRGVFCTAGFLGSVSQVALCCLTGSWKHCGKCAPWWTKLQQKSWIAACFRQFFTLQGRILGSSDIWSDGLTRLIWCFWNEYLKFRIYESGIYHCFTRVRRPRAPRATPLIQGKIFYMYPDNYLTCSGVSPGSVWSKTRNKKCPILFYTQVFRLVI